VIKDKKYKVFVWGDEVEGKWDGLIWMKDGKEGVKKFGRGEKNGLLDEEN
jgi:hypothetical protein